MLANHSNTHPNGIFDRFCGFLFKLINISIPTWLAIVWSLWILGWFYKQATNINPNVYQKENKDMTIFLMLTEIDLCVNTKKNTVLQAWEAIECYALSIQLRSIHQPLSYSLIIIVDYLYPHPRKHNQGLQITNTGNLSLSKGYTMSAMYAGVLSCLEKKGLWRYLLIF